jgi:hypothetical protein
VGRGKNEISLRIDVWSQFVFSLLVLLSIWLSLLTESIDSCEKQPSISKEPILAGYFIKIDKNKMQKCDWKDQPIATTNIYEKITKQEGWSLFGLWKSGNGPNSQDNSSLLDSGNYVYSLFFTDNCVFSTVNNKRTRKPVLRMAKISKHGKREKGDANAKHRERSKSKEERCKPKVKIKSTKASDVLKQTAEQDVAASKSLLPEVKMAKEAVLHLCEAAELLLSEEMAKDAELQMCLKERERQLCVKDEELATTSPNVIVLSGSESEIF